MNRLERAEELETRLQSELFMLEGELASGYTEHYLEVLAFYGRFHHYSFGNVMLIRQQMPEATRVAGLRKWNELGYKVRAGERACWIRAPWLRKHVDPETGEIEQKLVGYLPVAVFDVSQLEGEPKLPSISYQLEGDFEAAYLMAKVNVICAGIFVDEHSLPTGIHGISWGNFITIASELSVSEKLATLYHELVHEVSDHRVAELSKNQKELEAESAAWLVARMHGMTIPWSADYIRSYHGHVDDLQASFRRIQQIVKKALEILHFEAACDKAA